MLSPYATCHLGMGHEIRVSRGVVGQEGQEWAIRAQSDGATAYLG